MSPLDNMPSPEDKKTEAPKTSLLSMLKNFLNKEEVKTVEKLDTLKDDVVSNKEEDPSDIPSQEDDEKMASIVNDQIQADSLTKQGYTSPSDMDPKDVKPYTQEELVKYGLVQK